MQIIETKCFYFFKCGWYWGSVSPDESETLLSEKSVGSFLLRDSSDDRFIFTLSVKTNDGVVHVRINQHKGESIFEMNHAC